MEINGKIDEIEMMICQNELTKEQVFTRMKSVVQQLQNTSSNSDYVKCAEAICSLDMLVGVIYKQKVIETILRMHFA
jgi:hypothetical protein